MSYTKIYRGEFANTLPDSGNAPNPQTVRIDISDTTQGTSGGSMTGTIIVMGGSAFNFAPPKLIPDRPLAERTAFWQTYADFFLVGMGLRVTGSTASDGDYIVTSILEVTPTNVTSDDPGSLDMTISPNAPGTSLGEHDITFENITTPEIIPLDMAGDPLHISVIDDDEDKFTPVRSKQAAIKVLTSLTIDINTFCDATDDQFYVEVFIDSLIIFRGFLMIPDMQQDFQPKPNELLLTATDNLPALKNFALVDGDDATPQFDWRLIDYIRWALRKTGIGQNINIVNSLLHGTKTFTATSTFITSTHTIVLAGSQISNFYAGMQLTVSGTTSNNGTYTVVAAALFTGLTLVVVRETLVDESNVSTTYTDTSSALPFHQAVYVDAKTFEASVGTCEDSYSVLSKILGEDSVLFQYQGEWWILRIDEIEEISSVFQYNVNTYDISDGSLLSSSVVVKEKNIGKPDTMQFMNDNAVIIPDRGVKHVKETYKFDNPQELICNLALERGELIGDLPDETIQGAIYNVQNFIPECWTLKKNLSSDLTTDTDGWLKTYSQNGYVKNRSLSIEESPSDSFYKWVSDVKIPVNISDKFTISCEFLYKTNLSLAGPGSHVSIAMFYIRLYATDGTFWTMYGTDGPDAGFFAGTNDQSKWVQSNAAWTTDPQLCYYETQSDAGDFLTPTLVSIDSAPMPRSGKLEIGLVASIQTSTSAKEFQSIRFDYIPMINGSYQRYTGQYNQVSQNTGYNSLRDKQVYISDSPSLLFKGAMKVYNGTDYVLTYGFTDAHWTTATPYGKIQAFAVWNQYKYNARNFDEDVDQLESDSTQDSKYNGVDLIHKINLTDANENTNNWFFILLHYEQDFYELDMTSYAASLYRKDLGKSYDDEFTFKYITQ